MKAGAKMKKVFLLSVMVVLTATLFLGCGGGGGGTSSDYPTPNPSATIPPHNLTGKVLNLSGNPLVGAAISIGERGAETTTDQNGNYYAELETGRYEVNVQREDGRWVFMNTVSVSDSDPTDLGNIKVGFFNEITSHSRKTRAGEPYFGMEYISSSDTFVLAPFGHPSLITTNDFQTYEDHDTGNRYYDLAFDGTYLYGIVEESKQIDMIETSGFTVVKQLDVSETFGLEDGNWYCYSLTINSDGKFVLASNTSPNVVRVGHFDENDKWVEENSYPIDCNISSLDFYEESYWSFDQRHNVLNNFSLDQETGELVILYSGNIPENITWPQAIKLVQVERNKEVVTRVFAGDMNAPTVYELQQE